MKTRSIETEGLVTDKFIPHEDKGVVHQRIVNHKPILDHNKKLYTQNDGNWFALPKETQQKILRQKLNSSDYRYFRTAEGRF